MYLFDVLALHMSFSYSILSLKSNKSKADNPFKKISPILYGTMSLRKNLPRKLLGGANSLLKGNSTLARWVGGGVGSCKNIFTSLLIWVFTKLLQFLLHDGVQFCREYCM